MRSNRFLGLLWDCDCGGGCKVEMILAVTCFDIRTLEFYGMAAMISIRTFIAEI